MEHSLTPETIQTAIVVFWLRARMLKEMIPKGRAPDLLLCAKHLFVAAMVAIAPAGAQG